MSQKPEWEVVSESPRVGGYQMKDVMKALLGPGWRWKLAGFAAVALIALSVLTVFAGIAIVGLVTVALLLIVAAKIRSVIHRFRRTSGPVQRHPRGPL